MQVRPATGDDRDAAEEMILERCAWMEERGLPSWRTSAGDLADQCGGPDSDVWVLERDGAIVGMTTLQCEGPPYGWTQQEQADRGAVPVHDDHRSGTPGRAARNADRVVGRRPRGRSGDVTGASRLPMARLAAYYRTQGYALVREAAHGRYRHHMLARRAAPVPAATEWLRTGMRPPRCPG